MIAYKEYYNFVVHNSHLSLSPLFVTNGFTYTIVLKFITNNTLRCELCSKENTNSDHLLPNTFHELKLLIKFDVLNLSILLCT